MTTVKNSMYGFAPEFRIGKGSGHSDLFGLANRSVAVALAVIALAVIALGVALTPAAMDGMGM